METSLYKIKTIQREAAPRRGLIQGEKEVKTTRVRVGEHMGLKFGELRTESSE
jgi:hypothetical protein